MKFIELTDSSLIWQEFLFAEIRLNFLGICSLCASFTPSWTVSPPAKMVHLEKLSWKREHGYAVASGPDG
jgi:hypothetical protein